MSEGLFRRRRLPQWDVDDATYFVTTCLADSLPAQGIIRLKKYRQQLERRPRPSAMAPDEWDNHEQKLVFALFDEIIDTQPTLSHLSNVALANEVESSLRHFAGERYDLLAYVVMPSHFHWVFHPRESWVQKCLAEIRISESVGPNTPRQQIVKSVNGYSARQCNRQLGRIGQFWQDESYDHVVRDEDELFRIINYVENNPVKARLVERPDDWQWSSARDRELSKIPYGEPFPSPVGQTFLSAKNPQLPSQSKPCTEPRQTRMSAPRLT